MKIKRLNFVLIILLLAAISGYAQNKNTPAVVPAIPAPTAPAKIPAPAAPAKIPVVTKPQPVVAPLNAAPQSNVAEPLKPAKPELGHGVGMGLKFSTNGLGLEFSKSLKANRSIVLRGFGTYSVFSTVNQPYQFNKNVVLNMNSELRVGAIGLLFDFHPFKNSFKFTLGAAVMLLNAKGTAMMKDSLQQNDLKLSPAEVGSINTEIHAAPIAPYAGIGFGRAIPRKRVGFSMEIGTYYIGSPKVSFVCTGMLEPTSNQQSLLEKNQKENKWLPQLMFNLNFRLTK